MDNFNIEKVAKSLIGMNLFLDLLILFAILGLFFWPFVAIVSSLRKAHKNINYGVNWSTTQHLKSAAKSYFKAVLFGIAFIVTFGIATTLYSIFIEEDELFYPGKDRLFLPSKENLIEISEIFIVAPMVAFVIYLFFMLWRIYSPMIRTGTFLNHLKSRFQLVKQYGPRYWATIFIVVGIIVFLQVILR